MEQNLFVSMENVIKHFWCINKYGWSYSGPAACMTLIWWLGNSFLHTKTCFLFQDLKSDWGWTMALLKSICYNRKTYLTAWSLCRTFKLWVQTHEIWLVDHVDAQDCWDWRFSTIQGFLCICLSLIFIFIIC